MTPRLTLLHFHRLDDPDERAIADVCRHHHNLERIAARLTPMYHALALDLIRDWRMYCFEQNSARWPDGAYHLVDRSYALWRGHRIAFRREELAAFGLEEWDRRVIRIAHDRTFVPMQADCFERDPRRRLREFALIVGRIGDYLKRSAMERAVCPRKAAL